MERIQRGNQNQGFEITTDAIDANGFFDPRYTCDFDNSSPELRWSEIPAEAKGFALIAEDPDAPKGLFTHWVVYNIPAHVHHLPAGIPAQETLPNGIRQGINGFGKLGYGGPCPPPGDRAHRYFFRLFALRDLPELPSRATRDQVMEAIQHLVVATAELVGRYQRAIQKAG
jgi:Raf kinase inhibitor-like YbhB/YbcL family protein